MLYAEKKGTTIYKFNKMQISGQELAFKENWRKIAPSKIQF